MSAGERPAAADLNGDGYADLLIGGSKNGTAGPFGVFVCLGKGDGTFAPSIFYQTGTESEFGVGTPALGDFNGDGISDFVASSGGGMWFFSGKGDGTFNPGIRITITNAIPTYAFAADFNGDGKLDAAVLLSNGFAVLFGNGDGTFQAPAYYAAPGAFMAIGHVEQNNRVDIAVGGGTGGLPVYVFRNDGQGVFSLGGKAQLSGFQFTIGDVNNDGLGDIVDDAGCVSINQGNLKFAIDSCYPLPTGESDYNVVLADLRKNGLLDIVAGELPVTSVLLNQGDLKFQDGLWVQEPSSANCAAAADFNGDGKADLALPIPDGILMLFGTGNADAPYVTGPTFTVTGGIGCPTAGDINGDGIPDLIFGSNAAGGLVTYLGNGDGTFAYACSVPMGPSFFVLGDFNNDGNLDIVSAANVIAYGNGDGTFQTPVTLVADPPVGGFSWVAAGDLTKNTQLDIVLTAFEADDLYILLNDGRGEFKITTVPAVWSSAGGPIVVWLTDLNGDGDLDAVVQLYYGAGVAIFMGDGRGGLKLKNRNLIRFIGSDAQTVQVGDVNGDGIPDLLMPSSGSLGIAFGKGDGTFESQLYYGLGNGAGQIILSDIDGRPNSSGLPGLVSPDANGGLTILINSAIR